MFQWVYLCKTCRFGHSPIVFHCKLVGAFTFNYNSANNFCKQAARYDWAATTLYKHLKPMVSQVVSWYGMVYPAW